MKFLVFSILIFCAVKCGDASSNNYFVIEVPEDEIIKDYKRPFHVYWNVPTIQCKSKKVPFENLYDKFGIIQNDGDNFRGEKITILYDPGFFPAIFKNETSGNYRFRNGGVPQEGNLDEHLKAFKKDLMDIIPDPDFNGIGVIDFESWRPIFRQNFGTLVPYKDVSYEIEKKLHWWWPKKWINTEAEKRFETAARQFMQTTLSVAKQMRPKASWGYYGFPYCFNMAAPSMNENCPQQVLGENDLTHWMWSESSALYPSVYSSRNLTSSQLGSLVRGRLREANRLRRNDSPVLPYYWFRYREGGYMTEKDLNVVLKAFYNSNASGFIIWGSSGDVNTVNKCKNLLNYVETVLGPSIAKYIHKINIANDLIIETPPVLTADRESITTIHTENQTNMIETENNKTTSKVEIYPEQEFIPPLNYTQDISNNVTRKKPFHVYWNVPTIQCKSKKVPFENLYDKFGIIQNDGDNFRGEKITILYDPGFFPAILKNETSGNYRFRNGGVPQEGNLDEHLKAFKKDLMEVIPDPDFNGIGVIDFESWRPIFHQNFGTLVPYKNVSYEIEKKLHSEWPKNKINTEAGKRFETAARQFMQTTLSVAKQMRPKASWGYYGFPYCFNMAAPSMNETCPQQVLGENDLTHWMWSESSALYPSVYSSRNLTSSQLGSLVRGRLREANRLRRNDSPVLPYYWFRYREGGYMTEKDLNVVLKEFYNSNASGFIIWGSSGDVNTVNKCKNLLNYVETVLGPSIAKYIHKITTTVDRETKTVMHTENQTNMIETENNTTTSKVEIYPEQEFIPPLNYTQDISNNVTHKKPFHVYWNVPTMQCKSKKVPFENLYDKFGIIQNDGDNFRGEKITILYDPGFFPAILKNETSGNYRFRNGGVPQEGNLDEHLKAFKKDLMEVIPDPDFNGIGVIDFESWRPIFRQNFGTLVPYKDVSYEIENKLRSGWPKNKINTEAEKRFQTAARQFMQTTLSVAKQMRPKASWGYYGFPYCFNMAAPSMNENCPQQVLGENDLAHWMWSESSALYPSVYSSRNLTSSQLGSLVRGRLREANRLRRNNSPVLPYYWFRYREGGYMTEKDLNVVLKAFYNSNASGFIIWGSSGDVNTVNKCKNLLNYVETVLGPSIAKYIHKFTTTVDRATINTIHTENQTNMIETENNTTTSKVEIYPEREFIPPVNYTQDISNNVEKELVKKGFDKSNEIADIKMLNDSTVVDMIFDALIKSDKNDTNNDKNQVDRSVEKKTDNLNAANNLGITEAPMIKDLDTLSSMIIKDPLGFIEKLANEEKKIGFLDDPLTTIEPINDKEMTQKITKSPFDGNVFVKENKVLPETDNSFNGDVSLNTKNYGPTTSRNQFSERKENSVNKIEEQIEESELTTKTGVEYTKEDFTSKNELDITTDDGLTNFDELYTEISTYEEVNSKKVISETQPTTEINLSYTTENDPQITSSEVNVFSDQTDSNEGFSEFFTNSDLNVESSTQYNTAFNNEDNLIILAVNLTNQSISDSYIKTNKQTTESDTSTFTDSFVTESDGAVMESGGFTSKNELDITTHDGLTNFDELYTEISTYEEVNSKKVISETKPTTEINLSYTTETDPQITSSEVNVFSDQTNSNEGFSEFFTNSDLNVESSTQYNTAFNNEDNLIILAVNLTNQSISYNHIKTNEHTTESDTSTFTDSVVTESDGAVMESGGFTSKNELDITTHDGLTNFDENYTEISTHKEENSKKVISETKPTTEINLSYTTETDPQITSSEVNTFSDKTDSNETFSDFSLSITNSDLNVESSTQYNTAFNNEDNLIILAVNLTNQSISDNYIKTNEQITESDTSTFTDSVVTESDGAVMESDRFILNNNKEESFSEDESFTTDAARDQVVTYIYYQ